ncbi:DUF6470 family protein [Thermosediminibacter litoriperuensis]|uniref:Uncharacterized protein n=1 Tax=Thermosediminibacter litoriperuensis TaxID=291989 RepID=A0A5S5AJY9_9FIRM|nr:DUF6470 family protein [Thermosediminibacter litoriperuensis]TYP50916.1 hypothetical protein LZ11_01971 [Thermosediminibacter litoriperuensis]
MRVYTLDIKFSFGELGIDYQKGNMEIKKDIAGGFDLKKSTPELYIKVEHPRIDKIDIEAPLAEIGLADMPELSRRWFYEARDLTWQAVEKIVREGDALGAIEKGISISDLTELSAFPEKDFNVDFIPRTPPEIHFREGKVDVSLKEGCVEVSVNPFPLDVSYEYAEVKPFLEKPPYIKIKAVKVGEYMDIRI